MRPSSFGKFFLGCIAVVFFLILFLELGSRYYQCLSLDQSTETRACNLSNYPVDENKIQIIRELVERELQGNKPTRDDLIKAVIFVDYKEIYGLNGAACNGMVFVRDNLPDEGKLFVARHELEHIFQDYGINHGCNEGDYERCATREAAKEYPIGFIETIVSSLILSFQESSTIWCSLFGSWYIFTHFVLIGELSVIWKFTAFAITSAFLIYISRASLRNPHSHGFHRFFAWEAILALFLLNVDFWFRDPFAWHQIIAWILLFVSFIPLGFGVQALRARGKPTANREGDPSLLAFEKTTALVTTGIYRYIRHPLYSSLLLLAWGIFFKSPSWLGGVLVIVTTISLALTAKADEAECAKFFGTAYQDYMKTTRMFIPFLF